MIRQLATLTLFVLALWQTRAPASEEAQLAAIRGLGAVNGVALHCNGLEQTQRMKRALVKTLPKRRQLGELFDYETNKSFMAFIEAGSACPGPQALVQQVDQALQRLETVYGQ